MVLPKFANNATSTLSGAHSSGSTITVVSASLFPTITTGEYFYITVWDYSTYANPGDDADMEIFKVTSVSGNIFTIDGTIANSHVDGEMAALLLTEDFFTDLEVAVAEKRYILRTVRWNGAVSAGSSYETDPLPCDCTLVQIKIKEKNLCDGSGDFFNIFKNGATTTDSVLTSDSSCEMPYTQSAESNGLYIVEASLDSAMTSCNENDYFVIMCTAIGSTNAGSGVDVQLLFEVD